MRLLRILKKKTLADYILVFRIYCLLHLSKWYINRKHLKEIVNWISIGETDKDYTLSLEEKRYIRKIARYTEVLSKFTFHESKCYDQALTVKKIINDKKIPVALSMGLKISEPDDKEMKAHAWVNFDNWVIIGGGIRNNYTSLGSFY